MSKENWDDKKFVLKSIKINANRLSELQLPPEGSGLFF
jgi:hypothetical protein